MPIQQKGRALGVAFERCFSKAQQNRLEHGDFACLAGLLNRNFSIQKLLQNSRLVLCAFSSPLWVAALTWLELMPLWRTTVSDIRPKLFPHTRSQWAFCH